MYNKFFGFKEKPFKLVPNPEYLFLSKSHEEALAHLTYAISQGEGFVEITGEVGTGKTTLCRVFLENLDKSIEAAYIFNPKLDALQLLKAINDELGIDSAPDNTKDLIDRLNEFLIRKKVAGQKVLVLIDEAQNLSLEVLEQLRLLSNLETTQEKLLQIILVGQPELGDMLSSHQLRQLGQRITINCRLSPLTYEETRDYIRHRIALASHRAGPPFDKSSFRTIYEYSRGIPRLINIACDRALLNAFSRNSFNITSAITREAVNELTRKKTTSSGNWRQLPAGLAITAAIFIPLIILLLYLANGESLKISAGSRQPASEPAVQRVGPPPGQIAADGDSKEPLENSDFKKSTAEKKEPENNSAGATLYSVHVGSFPSFSRAEELRDQVKKSGYPAFISPEERSSGKVEFVVFAGSYPTPDLAREAGGRLNNLGFNNFIINREQTAAEELTMAERGDHDVIVLQQPQNSMNSQQFSNHLQGLNSRLSRQNSIVRILQLWRPTAEITIKQRSTGTDRLFFQETAEPYDMQVQPVATASDLTLLQTLNLPAIFTFYPPGQTWPKYLAVTAIDQGSIYFFSGEEGGTASVARDVFLRNWSGEAYILWKNFGNLQGVIGLRSKGKDVRDLKSLLQQLGYRNVSMSDIYDPDTVQIIKNIQTKYGLQIDGLVGPFTKIALYNENPLFVKPALDQFAMTITEKGS